MINSPVLVWKNLRFSYRLFSSAYEPFTELDTAILYHCDPKKSPILTKPLRSGRKSDTRYGSISQDKLLGLRSRDTVTTRTGVKLRVQYPSLEEYIELTPRLVTPIYPKYSSIITSLLDIHVTPSAISSQPLNPSLEILEAGTGHGALTLHLARALQAGNPPVPSVVQQEIQQQHFRQQEGQDDLPESLLKAYKSRRATVLHTLDISRKHSAHAQNIIRGFRRGMYYPTVDFHVGSLFSFLMFRLRPTYPYVGETGVLASDRHTRSLSTFFSSAAPLFAHIVLDLPDVHLELPLATEALQTSGSMLVFTPSITQQLECMRVVREHELPLTLERVLEVGTGLTGGRDWDLREAIVKSRGQAKERAGGDEGVEGKEAEMNNSSVERTAGDDAPNSTPPKGAQNAVSVVSGHALPGFSKAIVRSKMEVVCRPKVGVKVSGGGFIGLWRKMSIN